MATKQIPDAELLAMACEFNVGVEPIVAGQLAEPWQWSDEPRYHTLTVKNMGNPDGGPDRWAIIGHGSCCLNKDGLFQYQPMNSSKTEDFYARCQYASCHEAIRYFRRWKAAVIKWGQKKLAEANQGERVILNYEDCPEELRKFRPKGPYKDADSEG